jgi:sphingosine-1-phosphate phosphatase 1
MMASLYSFLKDPETVAKFQQLCGIVRIADPPASTFTVWSEAANAPDHANPLQKCPAAKLEGVTNGVVASRRPVKETNGKGHVPNECEIGERSKLDKADAEYVINNRLLYYIFHFGANLGNEIFYVTFLPFWFWNIDGCVGRQLSTFWCIFMYIGQALKDVIRIPRPAAPPAVQLEKRYALEYGMPSTHAMVGAGIPFAIFFLTKERYIVRNFELLFFECEVLHV